MRERNYLFSEHDLGAVIDRQKQKLLDAIGQLPPSQLLSADDKQVCAHFVGEHTINPIILREGPPDLAEEPREIETDSTDGYGGRVYRRKALEFRFEVPFVGDAELFRCQPSMRSSCSPCADVIGDRLVFTIVRSDRDKEAIQKAVKDLLQSVHEYVGWQQKQIDDWNKALPALVQEQVAARRTKLEADNHLVTDLGFRVRRRGDPPSSYTFPVHRKAVVPPLPAARSGPLAKPEPTLEMKVYEEILDTLADMSVMMERSPSSFARLDEEALRDHFLIPLNTNFRGQATAETFNASGKTDILIKHEDRILFVAECKFWKGAQSLIEAIDQILGYLTWRETKAAILLFNRNRGFSKVLSQVPSVFSAHPQFVRQERYEKSTGFRFIVRHPNDANRHVMLTLLAFDVPGKSKSSDRGTTDSAAGCDAEHA